MLEKYPAERGGNWDLFNGILDEMRRLADHSTRSLERTKPT
jgi:hypothetical protein